MFNQIQVVRFSSLVRKLLRITEDTPMPQLSGELQPTVCLETDRPEWAYNAETRLTVAACRVAAAAANYSQVRIENPDDSGMLVVIKRSRIYCGGAYSVYTGWLTDVALGDPVTWTGGIESSRDGRWGNLQGRQPVMVMDGKQHTSIYIPTADRAHITKFAAAGDEIDETPWVLRPGDTLGYCVAAVNVEIDVTVEAYERALAPDEA
jgi:hypothetical protein